MDFVSGNAKTPAEKVAKVILIQARIGKLLSDIILEFIKQDWNGDNLSEIEDRLGITYQKKIDIIRHLSKTNYDIFEHLEKMGRLRNKIAHRDIMGYFFTKQANETISNYPELDKILGQQKTQKNRDLDYIFNKYSGHEEKVKKFFSLNIENQYKLLN